MPHRLGSNRNITHVHYLPGTHNEIVIHLHYLLNTRIRLSTWKIVDMSHLIHLHHESAWLHSMNNTVDVSIYYQSVLLKKLEISRKVERSKKVWDVNKKLNSTVLSGRQMLPMLPVAAGISPETCWLNSRRHQNSEMWSTQATSSF